MLFLRFIWKWKERRVAKTILKRKNKVELVILPDSETYSKAAMIKNGTGVRIDTMEQNKGSRNRPAPIQSVDF